MIHLDGVPDTPVKSLGLGVFDGLHLGHKELAKQCDTLLTFHPHPDTVLSKQSDLKHITTLDELRLLFPRVVSLGFSKEIASLSPEAFLNDVIYDTLHPEQIVVGYDYRFGKKRAGNFEFLTQWAAKKGIKTLEIPAFCIDGVPVKSGAIRRALLAGEFESAIALLGHPFLIKGKVVKGDGRGASLGFPTANLEVSTIKLIPANGVYGGTVEWDGTSRPCIVYIGNKPTFGEHARAVEVHVPQFEGNLYDQTVTVSMAQHIRGEKSFETKDDLIAQITHDLEGLSCQ